MISLGGKLTALACYPTKKVNKAKVLTCLSTNIDLSLIFMALNYCLPSTLSQIFDAAL
jgi:hypothetical protein